MTARHTTDGGDQILSYIRQCIEQDRYAFTSHAQTKHPIAEGFSEDDAIAAIFNGEVIEHYPDEGRCLVCGPAAGIAPSPEYIANYVHVVVKYDELVQVSIITMYRPRSSEWINHFRRRSGRVEEE